MTKIEQPKKKFEELQQKQNFFISSTKYQMPAHTFSARTFRHSVVRDAICLHLDQHNQVRNGKTLRPVIERLPKSLIPPKFAGKGKCINDIKNNSSKRNFTWESFGTKHKSLIDASSTTGQGSNTPTTRNSTENSNAKFQAVVKTLFYVIMTSQTKFACTVHKSCANYV